MKIFEKLNELLITKVYAQSLGERIDGALDIEEGVTDPNNPVGPYIDKIVKVAAPVAVIACFILLVYGGYLLSSSGGNPDKIQEAKSIITNAIIGLLVVLLSAVLLMIIGSTIGDTTGENIYN